MIMIGLDWSRFTSCEVQWCITIIPATWVLRRKGQKFEDTQDILGRLSLEIKNKGWDVVQWHYASGFTSQYHTTLTCAHTHTPESECTDSLPIFSRDVREVQSSHREMSVHRAVEAQRLVWDWGRGADSMQRKEKSWRESMQK